MPPELRRLLRWGIPLVTAIPLIYCAWQAYFFSLVHGGEIYDYAGPYRQMVLHLSTAYGLLLPTTVWLGQPRNNWLRLLALAGVGLSEGVAFRFIEAYHCMEEVRAFGFLALLVLGVVSLVQLIRRWQKRTRPAEAAGRVA